MPSAARDPSRAVARLLGRRRRELGLTLRQVQDRTAERGHLIPFSTLAKIEQGKVEPGVKRLALLMRLYGVPFRLAGDLVEIEELAEEEPEGLDLETLYREGIDSWKCGEVGKGLAHLFALRQLAPSTPEARRVRQRALLAFAITASALGKYGLSREIVDDLLVEPPARDLLLPVLVQASVVWRGLGSSETSMAFLERAEKHLDPERHKQRGWIRHGMAKTLLLSGEHEKARAAYRDAVEAYREAGDDYGECLALALGLRLARARGDDEAALRAARDTGRLAETRGHLRLATLLRIEEGRCRFDTGETARGLEMLREGLDRAVSRGDREAEFQAHYHLWKVHEALGENDLARAEREAARDSVRFVDESSEETDEVRGLGEGGGGQP